MAAAMTRMTLALDRAASRNARGRLPRMPGAGAA